MSLKKEIYSAFEDVVGTENICDDPVIMPAYHAAELGAVILPKNTAEVQAIAVAAEDAGWDGFFMWDHNYAGKNELIADPWITLAAVAARTEKIRIGTTVTPLPRRRPEKVAREVATLDILSKGRFILGVGLGGSSDNDYRNFGEDVDLKEVARLRIARVYVRKDWLGRGLDLLDNPSFCGVAIRRFQKELPKVDQIVSIPFLVVFVELLHCYGGLLHVLCSQISLCDRVLEADVFRPAFFQDNPAVQEERHQGCHRLSEREI